MLDGLLDSVHRDMTQQVRVLQGFGAEFLLDSKRLLQDLQFVGFKFLCNALRLSECALVVGKLTISAKQPSDRFTLK